MCSKCPLQHKRKRVDAAPLDIITFNNRVSQRGPLAVDASFQFVDVRDLGTIDLLLINVKEVTDFQWFSGLTIWFSEPAWYPAWIDRCKRPNYDLCISQGSVATVLRLGGENWGHLCHVSSRCCVPKIIKFGQCFTGVIHKITLAQFFLRHGVHCSYLLSWFFFCRLLVLIVIMLTIRISCSTIVSQLMRSCDVY